MLNRLILLLCSIVYSTPLFSQTVGIFGERFETPDQSAEFPGGLDELRQYVDSALIYPASARHANIQGKTFIVFVVDSTGFIEKSSVRTLVSLNPMCDKEAERTIRSCQAKWKPAMKKGKAIRQRMVLPILFKLDDSQLVDPIKAIVSPRPPRTLSGWAVYADENKNNEIGRINPGDSVEVLGWGLWSYIVNHKSVRGYISWKGVVVSSALAEIAAVVEKESPGIELRNRHRDSVKTAQATKFWLPVIALDQNNSQQERMARRKADSLEVVNNPNIFFRITSSKKDLYVGECAMINLALYINDKNTTRVRFHDLQKQLSTISHNLPVDGSWIGPNDIKIIDAMEARMASEKFIVYPIYRGSICPCKTGSLRFEPLPLELLRHQSREDTVGNIVVYKTKPLVITVNPLPSPFADSESHKLVGKFMVSDSLLEKKIKVGQPVTYQLTIKGAGLTFPLYPPVLQDERVMAKVMKIDDGDTIVSDTYFSQKTFTYSLTFKQAGTYNFTKATFSAFNTKTKGIEALKSNTRIVVEKESTNAPVELTQGLFQRNNIIALDVSKSMMIEDYKPNRLKASVEGIANFLTDRETCDVGLIVFGGSAKQHNLPAPDSCYFRDQILLIDYGLMEEGTAIWEALWLAIHSIPQSGKTKKVVIIGDGDNTAGFRMPVIELALKYNVKIYAIGIGRKGLVPFGKDLSGKPLIIDNTFTDQEFKEISSKTGGKYYWAKDADSVTEILGEIFSN
jgi:TonB family protein